MAEHVQASLDAMVAPLLDLQEREIFTPEEVRAIVARRRQSEYQLRRRHPRKADFVSYLQDEMRLEQLRQLRAKRQRREELKNRPRRNDDDGNDRQSSKHIGDRHVMQHVLLLWTRTMRKYRDDLSLWLSYVEFLKTSRKHQKLSAVYGEALRFHPRATGLWIEASGLEYFERSNVDAARVLLQRGLRLNPKSRELWLQAFVLELHVVQKLQGRRVILKPEATESDDEEKGDANETSATTKKDPYALARIVLDHAAQELKNDKDIQSLWLECLESCQSFPSRSTHALQRELLRRLRASSGGPGNSSHAVMSWMAEAAWVRNHPSLSRSESPPSSSSSHEEPPPAKRPRVAQSETKARDPVLQVLREATQTICSEEMYREAIQFLSRHIRHLEDEAEDDADSDNDNDARGEQKDDALSGAWSLLNSLWAEAKASDFFTARMVLGYVDFLLENADVEEDDHGQVAELAIQVLQGYLDNNSAKEAAGGGTPASVWLRLAHLQFGQAHAAATGVNMEDAAATLRRGLVHTPPHQRDHLILLVQLMWTLLGGAKTSSPERSKELWSLLDRILLAYPGGTRAPTDGSSSDDVFDVRTVPEACLAFQRHVADQEGLDGSRKLYEKLLFHSGFVKLVLQGDKGAPCVEQIVDQAMAAESKCVMWKDRQTNILRIVDFALSALPKPYLGKYRKARDEVKYGTDHRIDRQLFAASRIPPKIPSFDVSSIDVGSQLLLRVYDVYQVVHLRNVPLQTQSPTALSWKDLDTLYQDLGTEDQKSWCVETGGQDDLSPHQFLKDDYSTVRAYCSFLVQNDAEALDSLLAKLPSPPPELLGLESSSHEPAVWVFFGRNAKGAAELDGRPEHTDSVSHDGTWHVQVSGKKRWTLRPSCAMLQHLHQYLPHRCTKLWSEEARMDVECSERDVLIINTRLWLHQTSIPVQPKPSVSLARDFRLTSNDERDLSVPVAGTMSNVDGMYARKDIEEGTIIFAEDEMPNAELHVSSTHPNCQVVVLDDGSRAVVASRPIVSGEFFCVPPSEDEGTDEDEGEEEGDRGEEASSD